MDTHVLIPVKRLDGAKSRLAKALDPAERADLVRELLEHVLTVVKEADVGPITIVSAEPLELDGIPRFDDRGLPWNKALSAAMTEVDERRLRLVPFLADPAELGDLYSNAALARIQIGRFRDALELGKLGVEAALAEAPSFGTYSIVWMTVEHGSAKLLDHPPRGILVGR